MELEAIVLKLQNVSVWCDLQLVNDSIQQSGTIHV